MFVLALVAILAMAALLFDGAYAYVQRRKLQDAGDAAALAGSNALQTAGSTRTCSATSGPPPGAPRADIVTAVLASIDANMPGFGHANVTITCPSGWQNLAVRVDLRTNTGPMFAGPVLGGPINVGTASTAINGQITGSVYSVVILDNSNLTWPNGRRGCPAVLLSGGPTVIFDGSMQVNSTCSAVNGGALATNGNASTLTMNNNAKIRLVGGYSPAALTITPAPLTGQPVVDDPLAFLPAVPITNPPFPIRSASKLTLNNETRFLDPGIYRGGIELRNTSKAFLRPGIYVIDGGGVDIGAQAEFCSLSAAANPSDCSGWAANCPDTTCGVLIFNRGTASGPGAMGNFHVAAGSTLRLRAYDERAWGNAYPEYRNVLIWQDATPAVSSSYEQPPIQITGGGSVDISGTLYAPGGEVLMGGGSGGSGGSVDLLVQFIVWDLEISGNASFHFFYSEADFARPTDYGLVQ